MVHPPSLRSSLPPLPLPRPACAATPMVALLMPYGQATVLGTSLAAMVPTTAAAVLQHSRWGDGRGRRICRGMLLVGLGCGLHAAWHEKLQCLYLGAMPRRVHPLHRLTADLPAKPAPRRLGNIDWRLGAGLSLAAVAGGAAGAQAAVHAPPYSLESAFCGALLFLARMTLKGVK